MNYSLTKLLGLLLLGVVTTTAYAATAPAQIPQTGQTAIYAAGDDGELQKGTVGTNSSGRFVAGTGGDANCITDKQTGLMWVKDLSMVNSGSAATSWSNAIAIATGGSWCGYSDWRLPNRNELRSLVNYGQASQKTWLEAQGFSNVQAGSYWSSTTYAANTARAWYVDMIVGSVGLGSKTNGTLYVWPVRGGQ